MPRLPRFLPVLASTLFLAPLATSAQGKPAIDQLFAKWDRADSPGCSVGVVQDGKRSRWGATHCSA